MRNKKMTWTIKDITRLQEVYPFLEKKDILDIFTPRNWGAIERKALSLGLRRLVNVKASWTSSEINLIKEKYTTSSKENFMKLIPNRTWKAIREKANSLGINRDENLIIKDTLENTIKNNLEKHGVCHSFQREDVKEKIIKTNQERYDVSYPQQCLDIQEKTKKNNLKNWGNECVLQSGIIRDKIIKDSLEKYGIPDPWFSEESNLKRQKTNVTRYGCVNPFGNENVKEKIKETWIDKYDVDNPQKNLNIRLKTYKTNKEKYGHEHPSQNEGIKSMTFVNNVEKYGVGYPSQLQEVKEKIKKTNRERYFCDNPAQNEEIKNKTINTNLSRYGVPWSLQNKEVRSKAFETICKNKSFTKSKPEEHLLEFLRVIDSDIEHHKKHPELGFVIDYYSPRYDMWIQFDGIYWHGKNTTEDKLKEDPRFSCRDSNASGIYRNIQNDKIQNTKIGNLIRFWEDDFRKAFKSKEVYSLIKEKFLEKGINLDDNLPSI